MAIANFIVMSYIATNHFLRPQSQSNNPIQNSMSVTTFKLLDKLHFNFSHHIEHHMFPRLSGCQLPAVRHWLVGEIGKQYVCPPHWKAMLYLYKTPRVYLDGETLCDPRDVKHTQVNIANITDAINQMPIR
jgi:fatty acid desaturase